MAYLYESLWENNKSGFNSPFLKLIVFDPLGLCIFLKLGWYRKYYPLMNRISQ